MAEPEMQPAVHPRLAAAMVAAFADMPHAEKNAQNPHIGNRYADLKEVLDTVRPVLKKHGLAVAQMPGQVTVLPDGGGVLVSITTLLVHESGHALTFATQVPVAPQKRRNKKTGEMEPEPVGAQVGGSGITYAKRYALQALFGFASADDDGEEASGRGGGEEEAPVKSQRDATFDGVKVQVLAKIAAVDAGDAGARDALKELRQLVEDLGDRDVAKAYVAKRAEIDAAKPAKGDGDAKPGKKAK